MSWNILTDFSPTMPPRHHPSSSTSIIDRPTTTTTSSSSGSSSNGAGWIVALFFAVTVGIGYILVQTLAPEANEPLGWFIFGSAFMAALIATLLLLLLLAYGIVSAVNFARRAVGRGFIKLGTWMIGGMPRPASPPQ